jgi:hypothetical protein
MDVAPDPTPPNGIMSDDRLQPTSSTKSADSGHPRERHIRHFRSRVMGYAPCKERLQKVGEEHGRHPPAAGSRTARRCLDPPPRFWRGACPAADPAQGRRPDDGHNRREVDWQELAATRRSVREYLDTLDDAAWGAASVRRNAKLSTNEPSSLFLREIPPIHEASIRARHFRSRYLSMAALGASDTFRLGPGRDCSADYGPSRDPDQTTGDPTRRFTLRLDAAFAPDCTIRGDR